MIEYLVICAAIAAALGIGMTNENSVLWELIDDFQKAFTRFSFAISLPT